MWPFKRRKKRTNFVLDDYENEEKKDSQGQEEQVRFNIKDTYQRERYIQNALMQIAEAGAALDTLNAEYSQVTSYLLDIEEIQALPSEEKEEIRDLAGKILRFDKERISFQGRENVLTQEEFSFIEKKKDEIPEGIEKIKNEEVKRGKIKQDLIRLEDERKAFRYRREELESGITNLRGMSIVILIAFVLLTLILFGMQYGLEMDVQMGYILSVAAAALVMMVVYMKYMDTSKELKQNEKGTQKLILLQNRVKIRFVNNVQLLDYLCLKFKVNNAKELENNWNRYNKELEERKRFENATSELEFNKKELFRALRRYRLADPYIWLHQTEALINDKEMVEIRHELIGRRQMLRKQMEYNQKIGDNKKEEIKELADQNPAFAKEILERVNEFEKTGK